MRNVEIVPFKAVHIEEELDSNRRKLIPSYKEIERNANNDSPAWTGICDGKVIGSGGVRLFWQGVGEVWAIYSEYGLNKRLRECLFWTKNILHMSYETHDLWRIQAAVQCASWKGMNWLKHLGFKVEGRLEKYDFNGDDCYLYSQIRKV